MPQVLVIRLVPEEPVSGAAFSNYLAGLKIEAWDVSFAKPKVNIAVDPPIGKADFNVNPAVTRIAQHWLPTLAFPPAAVATALLEITAPPAKEYANTDVLLRVTRNGTSLGTFVVEYNAATVTLAAVPPAATPPAASPFPVGAPALHVSLPSPGSAVDPNDAIVTLPKDGSPPAFADLKAAVQKVLSQDPGGSPALKDLTPAQCRHIAYEIAWNRHIDPLPSPSPDLEVMYTTDASGFDEKAHQIFQAELLKHRAANDAEAEVLANYIFAMVAALVCEQKSIDASAAGLRFPIQPGVATPSGKIAESEVVLQN